MPSPVTPFDRRFRRISRRNASVGLLALLLAGSCRWSTDPADVTPLDPGTIEVASVDEVIATAHRAVDLVPGETLELRFAPSLPVVELDGSVATYRLLAFRAQANRPYRIEVRSLPIVVEPPTNGFVVPRVAVFRSDGSREQTSAEYEMVGSGIWKAGSLNLLVTGITDGAGLHYVVLGTATDRIGEELWLVENPAEPGRALMDWSGLGATNLCTLAGDLEVQLHLLTGPDPGIGPGPGDTP